jgi:hypothetical protein
MKRALITALVVKTARFQRNSCKTDYEMFGIVRPAASPTLGVGLN